MIHARKDYDRIQDPANKIADGEPVFLLRARDILAPTVMEFWAKQLEEKCGDSSMIEMVRNHAKLARKWQIKHGCKLPDLPKNPLDGLKEDAKITSTIIEYLFDNGFDRTSLVKFTRFLESRNQRLLYYIAVYNNYNSRKFPVNDLQHDINCSFRRESELGSCFVDFRNSDEGLDFWTSFNFDWQNYIKS